MVRKWSFARWIGGLATIIQACHVTADPNSQTWCNTKGELIDRYCTLLCVSRLNCAHYPWCSKGDNNAQINISTHAQIHTLGGCIWTRLTLTNLCIRAIGWCLGVCKWQHMNVILTVNRPTDRPTYRPRLAVTWQARIASKQLRGSESCYTMGTKSWDFSSNRLDNSFHFDGRQGHFLQVFFNCSQKKSRTLSLPYGEFRVHVSENGHEKCRGNCFLLSCLEYLSVSLAEIHGMPQLSIHGRKLSHDTTNSSLSLKRFVWLQSHLSSKLAITC